MKRKFLNFFGFKPMNLGKEIELLFLSYYSSKDKGPTLTLLSKNKDYHPIFKLLKSFWTENLEDYKSMNLLVNGFHSLLEKEQNCEIRSYILDILGYCYVNGIGVDKNTIKAKNYYLLTESYGNYFASYNLGENYYMEKNFDKAAKHYLKASRKFLSESISMLKLIIRCYYEFLHEETLKEVLDFFCTFPQYDKDFDIAYKIILETYIKWDPSYHKIYSKLNIYPTNVRFQDYVLLLLLISKFRQKSKFSFVSNFCKNVVFSVIQQSYYLRDLAKPSIQLRIF